VWEATLFDCIDALAKQILFKALSDCADVSGDEISSVESDDDAAWSTHGSGYVGYEVTLGQESLTFVIGSVVIDALLGPSPCQENAEMLATRMDAVGSGYFKLELVAGAAEVTVGELHVLAPGHVIQLENLMGQPFKLRTVEGHEIGNGYLAACGANKAVHLVRNK
jgi:flagellar motor switch/type III secretory pathway protein FliN